MLKEARTRGIFPLYIPLVRKVSHYSGTNEFDSKENATIRYDTIEVELNGLKASFPLQPYRNVP
jgi:hypothetical protein